MNSTNRDMIRHKNSKNQLRLEGKSGDNEAKASAAQWFGLVRLRRAGGLCKDQPGAYLPWGRQQGRLKQRRPWKGELQRHVSHVFAIVDLADCTDQLRSTTAHDTGAVGLAQAVTQP